MRGAEYSERELLENPISFHHNLTPAVMAVIPMHFRNILITGGAGFVGSNIAIALRCNQSNLQITALDNLRRRGSELNLPRLREHGISFLHGDIRNPEDLAQAPKFDLLIDCSAEPSVQAGVGSSPVGVIEHNLTGSLTCAEMARNRGAAFLFVSTSRVYPIEPINALNFTEKTTRFDWSGESTEGFSTAHGISESFPLSGWRSMYGATKLAVEILLREFVALYKMPTLINRCGVLAGPWQMGKVDQGVATLWVMSHLFDRPLRYIGFGGQGKQVRDMLHIDDFCRLLLLQLADLSRWDGRIYNVGGGSAVSASLLELTQACRETTGRRIEIASHPETSPVDVRLYITDARRVCADYGWKPHKSIHDIVQDITAWVRQNESGLRHALQ